MVVLPELATSGYVFESVAEAKACAEAPDGPSLRAWQEAARERGAVIVGGFAERAGDTLHYSAAVVTGDGVQAVSAWPSATTCGSPRWGGRSAWPEPT